MNYASGFDSPRERHKRDYLSWCRDLRIADTPFSRALMHIHPRLLDSPFLRFPNLLICSSGACGISYEEDARILGAENLIRVRLCIQRRIHPGLLKTRALSRFPSRTYGNAIVQSIAPWRGPISATKHLSARGYSIKAFATTKGHRVDASREETGAAIIVRILSRGLSLSPYRLLHFPLAKQRVGRSIAGTKIGEEKHRRK